MTIKTALISVFDKTGLIELASFLQNKNIKIIATGGTAKALNDAKISYIEVFDITNFPEILEGRVKTLHPKIFGGILSDANNKNHQKDIKNNDIESIDIVVVNLYPFLEKPSIENIDIGGVSLLRAAAKNHEFVTAICTPNDYPELISEIEEKNMTSLIFRKKMAKKVFLETSNYDASVAKWIVNDEDEMPKNYVLKGVLQNNLRYGENPHQKAAFYSYSNQKQPNLLQGKEASFNNFFDADGAFKIACEFDEPAAIIVKHANPCGVAIGKDLTEAYKNALSCDKTSAFGGIVAFNKVVDAKTAEEIIKLFTEVVIAPKIGSEALDVFATKKNLRVFETEALWDINKKDYEIKNLYNGFLVQEKDTKLYDNLEIVTKRKPSKEELKDLEFAFKVVKHVRSNAIVCAKNQMTIGIGAGQMSRIDSSKIAAIKAFENFGEENLKQGFVVASDAFFPFADGLEEAAKVGATAVIQPGGSIKDEDVIKRADELNIAMVLTGTRHFKH